MVQFGHCSADMGSIWEWAQFLEFSEDENIHDYGLFPYGIRNGAQDRKLEKARPTQQNILRLAS